MNLRLAITAATAVILASFSLTSVIVTGSWVGAGIGAVAVVTAAGLLTRLSRLPSAVTATFLVLIAVVPLLSRPSWAERIAGVAIVVITALSATGARPLRAFAVLACYLASLLLYLNLAFARSASFGQVIPSYSSLSELGQLWRAAFVAFRYAPPVPDATAVSLVTSVGIGGVAIAVDILAVRLRRPAIAGLPLLLLFSVPVASNLKVFGVPQMVIFALGLAGYLALLSADGRERLRMWGRLVTFRHVQSADETGSGPDTREMAASGRRIGLAAVCLAIVIPVVLPSMHTHDLFATSPDGGGGGGGGNGNSGVAPLLQVQNLLERKQQQVLSYTTTAAHPEEQYFQVYVLNYNARQNEWLEPAHPVERTVAGSVLPWPAQGVGRSTPVAPVTTKIRISKDDTGAAFLPMPYAPTRVDVDGSGSGSGWTETQGSLMVSSTAVSMPGLEYTVWSKEADPGKNAIPANDSVPTPIANEYLPYGGPDKNQLLSIAQNRTAGATTALQAAKLLQNWFTSGAFTYSIKPNLSGPNWLLKFLQTGRKGFCSQFAQAFAVLARLIGIPSRIAIGYTGGTQGHGNSWVVSTADAHAWPELYFAGEGWLRFEPTPSGSLGQGTAEIPAYAKGSVSTSGVTHKQGLGSTQTGQGFAGRTGKRQLGPTRYVHGQATGQAAASRARSSDLWLAVGIPVALFLLIAWPALVRLVTRRRRWLTASGDAGLAHAAWRELADDLADYGLTGAPGETPRAVARRVRKDAHLDEPAALALTRIAAAEERARYARLAEPGAGLKADVVTVRRAVSASVSGRQRLRARLLPASTLLAARQLSQRASEMFGWLDLSWPAVRRQLRAAVHREG